MLPGKSQKVTTSEMGQFGVRHSTLGIGHLMSNAELRMSNHDRNPIVLSLNGGVQCVCVSVRKVCVQNFANGKVRRDNFFNFDFVKNISTYVLFTLTPRIL